MIEPFYTSVFLYDTASHARVSEVFSLVLDADKTAHILNDQVCDCASVCVYTVD